MKRYFVYSIIVGLVGWLLLDAAKGFMVSSGKIESQLEKIEGDTK